MIHSTRNVFQDYNTGKWHWKLGITKKSAEHATKRAAALEYIDKLMSLDRRVQALLERKDADNKLRIMGFGGF